MSGRTDSDTEPVIAAEAEAAGDSGATGDMGDTGGAEVPEDDEEYAGDARRARWTAVGTGALLTLAGLAAALLRAAGSAPALVPAAYALGAAGCALGAVLGSRGRTRRALWLLVAGTMVMALGDQFD
ncbi:hypothetical protein [Streptomyces echinatus]|uniref:hypothetical protein n=1 Tax=Streptomyces echinatus TaxID=67293 RepID=UPI00378D3039